MEKTICNRKEQPHYYMKYNNVLSKLLGKIIPSILILKEGDQVSQYEFKFKKDKYKHIC